MSGQNSTVLILEAETSEHCWCRTVESSSPNAKARVLSCFPRADGRLTEIVSLTGPGRHAAVEALNRRRGPSDLEVLDDSPSQILVKMAMPECALPRAMRESGVLPQFPFEIAEGRERWVLLGSKAEAQSFIDTFRREKAGVKVLYAGRRRAEPGLTARQMEILAEATRSGYYEFPRRINMSDLAARLGVSKSSLSETLMLIEKRIIASYVKDHRPARPADGP